MRRVLPTIVERTARGEITYDPYSRLLNDRIVVLAAPVDDTSAADIAAQLLWLDYDNPDREISLYINSPGGSVTAMLALYDTMQSLHAEITTYCLGQAGSAAALLLAAGTPGRRSALPHARVVLYQPGQDTITGSASDLEIQSRELLRSRDVIEALFAEHTGRDLAAIRADLNRQTVLTAADAVAYGLVDTIVQTRRRGAAA